MARKRLGAVGQNVQLRLRLLLTARHCLRAWAASCCYLGDNCARSCLLAWSRCMNRDSDGAV